MSFIISTLFMMVATDVSQFEGHNAHVLNAVRRMCASLFSTLCSQHLGCDQRQVSALLHVVASTHSARITPVPT